MEKRVIITLNNFPVTLWMRLIREFLLGLFRIPPWICVYINKKFQIFEFPRRIQQNGKSNCSLSKKKEDPMQPRIPKTFDRKISSSPSTTTINLALVNTVEIHFSCIWLSSKILARRLVFPNFERSLSWIVGGVKPVWKRGGRRNFIVTVSLLPGRQITSSPTLSIQFLPRRILLSSTLPFAFPPPPLYSPPLYWKSIREFLGRVQINPVHGWRALISSGIPEKLPP